MTSAISNPTPDVGLRVQPLAGLVVAASLFAALLVAGSTGDLTDQQVVERFVVALGSGDAEDVNGLLSDDPTIITWIPALPRPVNSTTMALIDVGRADQVRTGQPLPLVDYLGYYQGLSTHTELLGCGPERPRPGRTPRYDVWIGCRFASTNDLVDLVTGGNAVLRGSARFGVVAGEVRAALVVAEPTPAFQPVWDFVLWVRTSHPDAFEHWLQGRLHDPVISTESASALRRLAAEYASLPG